MMYSWDSAVIDAYVPLEDAEGWLRCFDCGEHPRVWVFDNGNYAKCRCGYKYDGASAKALSIIDAMYHRKMSYEEYSQLLRIAWNTYVRTKAILFQKEVMP